jgi:hypothetical protein
VDWIGAFEVKNWRVLLSLEQQASGIVPPLKMMLVSCKYSNEIRAIAVCQCAVLSSGIGDVTETCV